MINDIRSDKSLRKLGGGERVELRLSLVLPMDDLVPVRIIGVLSNLRSVDGLIVKITMVWVCLSPNSWPES